MLKRRRERTLPEPEIWTSIRRSDSNHRMLSHFHPRGIAQRLQSFEVHGFSFLEVVHSKAKMIDTPCGSEIPVSFLATFLQAHVGRDHEEEGTLVFAD